MLHKGVNVIFIQVNCPWCNSLNKVDLKDTRADDTLDIAETTNLNRFLKGFASSKSKCEYCGKPFLTKASFFDDGINSKASACTEKL